MIKKLLFAAFLVVCTAGVSFAQDSAAAGKQEGDIPTKDNKSQSQTQTQPKVPTAASQSKNLNTAATGGNGSATATDTLSKKAGTATPVKPKRKSCCIRPKSSSAIPSKGTATEPKKK